MLADIGYDKTTIRMLADKAGVAPGTLYNLYNSKDELILAAVRDLVTTIGERVRDSSQRGLDRLLMMAAVNSATPKENPRYAEAMTRALFGTERGDQLRLLLYTGYVELSERQLRAAIEQGHVLAGTDVATLAKHLQIQSWGVITAWVMGLIELEEIERETLRSLAMTLLTVATPAGKTFLRERLAKVGISNWPIC